MCGVAACQINGVFADIGCAEKRPWYHPVATQPHSVDGWISLVKTCSLMILGKKMWFVFYSMSQPIRSSMGLVYEYLHFFHENQAFFWIGGFIPLPWMVIHALDFSVFFRPPTEPTPPPGFFVSPSAIVYLLMINVRGAQVPKFFSWFQGLAKWWKIGMCFFQVGPYGRYKWGQKSPINDLYKWIAGVITPYNNNPCKWSSFTLLAYRRNAHRK